MEISNVYKNIPNNCFISRRQEYIGVVSRAVNDFQSNLAKLKLRKLWKDNTETEHPYDWSKRFETPILLCVPENKWSDYKRAFSVVNRQNPEDSDVKFALEFLTTNPIWDVLNNQEAVDMFFINHIIGNYKSVLNDLNEVRKHLKRNTQISPYDWYGNSEIARLIKEMAKREYVKEPYERVLRRIEKMDGDKLKDYLKRLIKNNMIVGIEILEDGEES